MKGEYISIETARIMADIEKENKKLQEENEKLKQKYKNKEYLRDTRTEAEKLGKYLKTAKKKIYFINKKEKSDKE